MVNYTVIICLKKYLNNFGKYLFKKKDSDCVLLVFNI